MKRIKTKRAAEILGVTPQTVRNYVERGHLMKLPDINGDKDIWFYDEDEVFALARRGLAGVLAYRELNEPPVAPKRGRKVGAR